MKKKKYFSKSLIWLKDAGFKAFAILLIVAVGFYAYAAITWPANPNSVSGLVGRFVGTSENTFSTPKDYASVNAWCDTGKIKSLDGANAPITVEKLGAHVCTPDEMINSYNHGGDNAIINKFFNGYTKQIQYAWVNNGPPAYAFNANDCQGWADNTNKSSGTAWDLDGKYGFLRDCGESAKPFACCM